MPKISFTYSSVVTREIARLEEEIEYLSNEEEMHEAMMNGCKKDSFDYRYNQRVMGIYFRARARAARELRQKQKRESTGFA